MGKIPERLTFSLLGASTAIAGITAPASLCGGGACPACLRCAGLGLILVVLALGKKGGRTNAFAGKVLRHINRRAPDGAAAVAPPE